ncbi:fungal protease inhibitor-1-like [Pectinophora gossypiella]|nr:fungal protease inhibitor-1-like [Pectinophora gossypiella]
MFDTKRQVNSLGLSETFYNCYAPRYTRILQSNSSGTRRHSSAKMKAVVLIALFACVVAVAYGDLVCGTNYCKQHPCTSPLPANSCRAPAEYRPNHSGKCACCPACVTLLSEDDDCKTYSKELGETPSAVCRPPLKCVGAKCVKVKN